MDCDMGQQSLEFLDPSKWVSMQELFLTDWPRGIPGYYLLETQMDWLKLGLDYGFKVYCPLGNVGNGMVALNVKDSYYEVIIQCPRNDTSKLEEALVKTQVVDWRRPIVVPYAPDHILDCVQRTVAKGLVELDHVLPSYSFVYYKTRERFKDISLPEDITFGNLNLTHVDLVNSVWPHRYVTSTWYFTQLIKGGAGFGLFKDSKLVSWLFVYEAGTLGHVYTLEEHRRRGLAEKLLKLVCNEMLRRNKDVFAFAVTGNDKSRCLFTKVGFEEFDRVSWIYLKPKI